MGLEQSPVSLVRINSMEDKYFNETNKLYIEAFIPVERREGLSKIIDDKRLSVNAILKNDEFVGFLNYWEFDTFVFAEHIAILPQYRSGGVGEAVFKMVFNTNKLIVGECEISGSTQMAERRVGYYKRLGLEINPYYYIQPSYGGDKEGVQMHFLSYPDPLSLEQFENISTEIREVVYRSI